ncbi:putative pyridoxal phosphate-dependent enzyme apparently involved in regulation of cell wall biogenesis [Archaeoglobus sulfaticallidus PM70-1]|uniref:Putative pyridoxal phosphate-dependent enzyme apparently involved in regulation of cell wall biogenesis n=1 Tax=Archaeoglobus sulfaticallidus PM70-1 TaxID=387631 RepID=N0BCY4_9EURY|nr:DegT/DnrJ/EryC1/StrS aminotransferase family protein [Archaeoglobus sulfaticallidus]AGK60087.1 putative pyridoxal phosphate-dependent enzyme apparently involved in regulation of cell wall biogenesis [Archaeoglobus sulfaticallidus PM70-1]
MQRSETSLKKGGHELKHIPISQPVIGEEEIKAVVEVLRSGRLSQGDRVATFEEKFAQYVGTEYAIAVNSGTSALHVALSSLGIGKGDEVITTTFSFVSTASCILMQGAKPVFVDIDPKTYNIEPSQIEHRITERTKAIIPVHLYGQPCEINKIINVAEKYNLWVIEDCAQALGAEYHGKKVGTFGDVACFSFYPTKSITTGEGGMIVTNDERIAERARMIRNHGQRVKYIHEILGYNYRMTDIAAAIGIVQLEKLEGFIQKRISNAEYYNKNLKIKGKTFVANNVRHVFNLYTIRVRNREGLIEHLKRNDIGYGIYYPIPLHRQPKFMRFCRRSLPEAERACGEVLSIPMHPTLTEEQLKRVCDVINEWMEVNDIRHA